ncbi:hypothetical protein HN011_012441 [Eciton burchellii]|nr:hypothetical protein HN011_012441 [Eciton burchellii]
MARCVAIVLLQVHVLSFALADLGAVFRKEHERRWNTPPELTPGSVKRSSEEETRLLSLVSFPVTANIGLNSGSSAHAVSLAASLDGVSLSESNSYDYPMRHGVEGSAVSVSKSTTVSAGLSGISSAGARAYSDGNNAETESHSVSFGQTSATAHGAVENGRAITNAASSAGISRSSAVSGADRFLSREGVALASARYPNRPRWSNVGPNNGQNGRLDRSSLIISQSHSGARPSLNIDAHDTSRQEQRPRIRIYKWQPNRGVFPRPSLSIEHHQPHHSWSDQSRGSAGLQVAASADSFSSSSSSYRGSSTSHSASQASQDPLSFALSSTSSSTSEHRGNSVAPITVQTVEKARGSGSSEGAGFVGSPEDEENARDNPVIMNIEDPQEQSDVVSDLADAIGELLDVVQRT